MRRILKFTLNVSDSEIFMPRDAKIIMVSHQPEMADTQIGIWAVCEHPDTELRRFRVYGTGHTIVDGDVHVGSAICGQYVWHLYEAG